MGRFQTIRNAAVSVLAGEELREIQTELVMLRENEQLFRESMSELQLSLTEDRGWAKVAAAHDTEFTKPAIDLITRIARVFRLKNPLIKRAVEIQADYVFGKGVQIKSTDPNVQEAISQFLADNALELDTNGLHDKECTLRTDGNLYFVLFADRSTGRVKVRTIDSLEIADKVCNPDDASEPWLYKRIWNQVRLDQGSGTETTELITAWYPAFGFEGKLPASVSGVKVQSSPVLHVKVGGLAKWKFGLSEVYAALDWAKAFTMFLESWATIQESLRRIALQVKTPGGTKAQQAIKQGVGQTTIGNSSGQGETNPPPVTGAWWIGGKGQELTPLITKNATTAPDEARQIKLQVCAAVGTPEHMFGDPSTSNLATAKTLDRPTELKFRNRQKLWEPVLQGLCQYAVDRAIKAPSGRLREAKVAEADARVVVTFPPLLEHDIGEVIGAAIDAATLKGLTFAGTIDPRSFTKMLWEQLPGIENVDAIVDAIYPDASYEAEEWAATPPSEAMPAPVAAPPGAKPGVAEALVKFREAVEALAHAA